MGIETHFHLVLHDVMGTVIMDHFLKRCQKVVSVTIADPNVTTIGRYFLAGIPHGQPDIGTSLRSVDLSGMVAVTEIGDFFS